MDRWQLIRTILLFVGGMAFAIHEIALIPEPRDSILLLAATMMGLPFLLNRDENGKKNGTAT